MGKLPRRTVAQRFNSRIAVILRSPAPPDAASGAARWTETVHQRIPCEWRDGRGGPADDFDRQRDRMTATITLRPLAGLDETSVVLGRGRRWDCGPPRRVGAQNRPRLIELPLTAAGPAEPAESPPAEPAPPPTDPVSVG